MKGHQSRLAVFDKFKDLFNANRFTSQQGSRNDDLQSLGEQVDNEFDDGAEMVRIDMDSTEGLGGTSEDAFGPLVSTCWVLGVLHVHKNLSHATTATYPYLMTICIQLFYARHLLGTTVYRKPSCLTRGAGCVVGWFHAAGGGCFQAADE